MKKVIRLTETELVRLVRRVIKEESEVTPEMIIDMLMKEAESTPQEDYDDVYDWMQDVFSPVEIELEEMGVDTDDLRMEYDDVIMGLWEHRDDDLLESELARIVKRVIKEQDENYKINMAIQCFLNKKGIKDDSGQSLKLDGSIGNLPNSKSAQAIAKYQSSIGVADDGVWGYDTNSKMPPKDKIMYKQCISDHGDLFDKGMHLFGID